MTVGPELAYDWRTEALRRRLDPLLPAIGVEVLARIDSTNSELLHRLRSVAGRRRGDLDPTLLVAEHQARGRGRMDRPWRSAPGASLTFSLALPLPPGDASGMSLAVGVALADALDPPAATPPRIGLKWPNDLWCWDGAGRGRKLGGILVETVPVGGERMAVVGVGLNVRPLDEAPDDALSQGYACLAELDPTLDAPGVLACVAPALAQGLIDFAAQGLGPVRQAYARRDVLAGQTVTTVNADGQPGITGVGVGIDASGALRLRTGAGIQTVISGEVSVRLPTMPGGPAC